MSHGLQGKASATLLPNGEVLAVGGDGKTSAELYDPASHSWREIGFLPAACSYHSAVLLADGHVLVSGGYDLGFRAETYLYDTGLGYWTMWQPTISTASSSLILGMELIVTGSNFRSHNLGEASGGAFNNSASNYPLVQLRRLDNGQTVWLSTLAFTSTSLTTQPVTSITPGFAALTIFVNGIPSQARIIRVAGPGLLYLPLVSGGQYPGTAR